MTLREKLLFMLVEIPLSVVVVFISLIITWPLKKLKLMKWDYLDYMDFISDDKPFNWEQLNWKQEGFYKIKYEYGCSIFDGFLQIIPMFGDKVLLTIDENPVDLMFSKQPITPGTIKTNVWNWHIHKDEIIHKLKQKRIELKEQKIMEDF